VVLSSNRSSIMKQLQVEVRTKQSETAPLEVLS
jgi:hypothetical protein